MAGVSSAHYACGQILFSLKNTKLNYVVKETPFSAYITIRKKFLKSATDVQNINDDALSDKYLKLKELEAENSKLKDRNKAVESEYSLLNIDLEEVELKCENLDKLNLNLEDKCEELVRTNSNLLKQMSVAEKELKEDNNNLKNKLEQQKQLEIGKFKDKCDLVDILEITLKDKKTEIEELKLELSRIKDEFREMKKEFGILKDSSYKCESCDYRAVTGENLKAHIRENHENTCLSCNLEFETHDKLKKHKCKIIIHNPEFKYYFVKNWLLTHGCSVLFNRNMKKEVAILHSDTCWNLICPCRELPGWYTRGQTLHDADGVFHVALNEVVKEGKVDWQELEDDLEDE